MPQLLLDKNLHSRGYVTLLSVLIVTAVAAAVSTFLLLSGLNAAEGSFFYQQSQSARAVANACAEHALNQLRLDINYIGSETLSLGSGSCQVLLVLGSGNSNRTIQALGTAGDSVRKIKIIVLTVRPQIQLTSWREVADF